MLVEVVKILIAVCFGCLFVFSFKKASGSLSLDRLNINGVIFYYALLLAFIGGNLIFLGFRDNYYLENWLDEACVNKAFFIMSWALIALPLTIAFVNKLTVGKYSEFYKKYQKKEVILTAKSSNTIFTFTVILAVISTAALVYTFYCIGYIPQWQLLKGNIGILSQRENIKRYFTGNQYIRNLAALTLMPTLSYMAYICCKVKKEPKWKYLFWYLFFCSVLCKTHDFEKAPILTYLSYFYLIDILLGKKLRLKRVCIFAFAASAYILFAYIVLLGHDGSILTLSGGPLGRIFISQIVGLFLHVQTFPSKSAFLNGASFSKTLAWIFGGEHGIRSGRVVMTAFNPSGVRAGTAGVINTLFVAEAYANFDIVGVIVAPICVGLIIALVSNFILKQKKDPLYLTLYIACANWFVSSLTGGFTDYFFNPFIIILIAVFVYIKAVLNRGIITFSLRGGCHSGRYGSFIA